MFASDQSDVQRIHKVRRVPLLTYTANGSKLRKVLTMKTKFHSLNHTAYYFMSGMNLL